MKTRILLITGIFFLITSSTSHTKSKSTRTYRRKRVSSKKPKVTLKKMTYEQLVVAKDEQLADNNFYVAIKYLKRLLILCTNIDMIAEHLIELGDTFVNAGKYAQAVKIYKEFIDLYPGHHRIEYVAYRAVIASFNCTHDPDRDQTPTYDTIALADAFLARGTIFSTHRTEVTAIRNECYQKLLASELSICSFYLGQGQETVVQNRLTIIEEDFAHEYAPTTQVVQTFRSEFLNESLDTPASSASLNTLVVTKNTEKPRAADKF